MSTRTNTRTTTVTATETRVSAILQKVRVDFFAASSAGLATTQQITSWIDDLNYMLLNDALQYFELRLVRQGKWQQAWRYTISSDGTLLADSRAGGIDFYGMPTGTTARLTIQKKSNLPVPIGNEIIRRGWTQSVESLFGTATQERSYSKDGYGVTRSSYRR